MVDKTMKRVQYWPVKIMMFKRTSDFQDDDIVVLWIMETFSQVGSKEHIAYIGRVKV
jgi:hypothetical protein